MDNTYVSKDDGLTWTKRVGNSLTRSVYGGKFVDVGTSLSLITKRNQRTDGSSISPDVITIGQEGATTVIGSDSLIVSKINATTIGYGPSNTISLESNVNVSMGVPITTGYSYTTYASNSVTATRLAYGNGLFVLVGDGKLLTSPDGITWTNNSGVTPTVFRGIAYGNGKFMLISNGAPSPVWTSDNGLNWTSGTAAINSTSYLAFGNGVFIAGGDPGGSDTTLSVTTGTGSPIVWSPKTITGIGNVTSITFGAMSNGTNGTNVFIATSASGIRRSTDKGDNWQAIANPTGMGVIRAGGFGNDIFMVCSFDYPGALSISRDGGLTWSASILFGFYINNIIYIEKNWYIGTESNIILTSNDDGITWRKIDGPAYKTSAYGNSIFVVSSWTNQSVIRFKKKRNDGSFITSDTITIGREGTTTMIGSDKIIGVGSPTTALSFTPKGLPIQYTRIAYGGGKFVMVGDPNKVYHSSDSVNWTQATNITILGALRTLIYAKDKFMIVNEDTPSKVYTSGDGGANWLLVNPSPAPSAIYRSAYGNNYVVAITANSPNISVSNNLAGTAWSNATLSGINLYGVTFGSMSNGTNVFIVYGPNGIRRNAGTTLNDLSTAGNWSPPSTPPGDGIWNYGAFGNDTFIVTSTNFPGLLTISRDGGNTWSVPISFGISLRFPIYADGDWFIGSDIALDTGFIMISKNNGLTWEKRSTGTDIYDFAYGHGLLISVNYNSLTYNRFNVIGLKKIADDGSNITSDTITIGTEGTTTHIKGSINISGTIGNGPDGPINMKQQLIVGGNLPYATNHCFAVLPTSSYPSGILVFSHNDTYNIIASMAVGKQSSRGGIVGVNADTVAFPTSSDRRLKKNIKPMSSMLDKIMSLKPSEYNWISTDIIGHGFIAQEVHQLFPEMRYGTPNCDDLDEPCDCETGKPVYYGLDYGKFTPYMVKAVQEMKLDYDAKFQEIKADYDAKISNLEARLLALETKV